MEMVHLNLVYCLAACLAALYRHTLFTHRHHHQQVTNSYRGTETLKTYCGCLEKCHHVLHPEILTSTSYNHPVQRGYHHQKQRPLYRSRIIMLKNISVWIATRFHQPTNICRTCEWC